MHLHGWPLLVVMGYGFGPLSANQLGISQSGLDLEPVYLAGFWFYWYISFPSGIYLFPMSSVVREDLSLTAL